jgi:hypothetical protein
MMDIHYKTVSRLGPSAVGLFYCVVRVTGLESGVRRLPFVARTHG